VRGRIAPGKPTERLLATIPDLVVEIFSPDDLYDDVQHAILTWLNASCPMVVTVNPRLRSATVFRTRSNIQVLRENDAIEGGDVVPGWTLPLRELFG
jgi:Uma2 family endonuclease